MVVTHEFCQAEKLMSNKFLLVLDDSTMTDNAPLTSQIKLVDHFRDECDIIKTTMDQQEMDQ